MKEKKLLDWLKRDFYVIIVLLVALLGCLYTLYYSQEAIQGCNEHWVQEFKDKHCTCSGTYITYEVKGDGLEIWKSNNS